MITIAHFSNTARALDKLAGAVGQSLNAIPEIRRSVDTGMSRLEALGTVQDSKLAEHISALKNKGSGIQKLNDKVTADLKIWITAYNALVNSVKTERRFEYIRMKQENIAAVERGQALLAQLDSTAVSLINEAHAIEKDAKLQSGNISDFVDEVKGAENSATGGGTLNKIKEIASLPGQIVGGTVSDIVSPVSGLIKFIIVGGILALGGYIWFTTRGMMPRKKAVE